MEQSGAMTPESPRELLVRLGALLQSIASRRGAGGTPDAADAILWESGPGGACTFLSHGWCDYTGQAREQALGSGWASAAHPEDRERARRAFLEANRTREPFAVDYRLRRRDGAYRWVLDSGRPRHGAQGEFLGFVGSVLDVHELSLAEETRREVERRLRFLVELTACTQPLTDPALIVETTARLLGEQVGADRCAYAEVAADGEQVVIVGEYTRGVRSILGPQRMSSLGAEAQRRAAANQPFVVADVQADARIAEGERAFFRHTQIGAMISIPLHKGGRMTARMAVHQKTPRRWTPGEVELVQLVVDRCWESIERARAVQALQEADRRKDEFLATLSHELRNPLAPLRNSLQALRLMDQPDSPAAPIHERMERQVEQLVRLVDDLLEVSRITRGTFALRREGVDLAAIVRAAVETSSPSMEAAGHRLELSLPDEPLRLDGDPVRLTQILANLLNNAARYTPPGGRISVTLARQADTALVSVRDSGAGIAPEALPRLFEMFSRGADSSGLGIGLALCRRLAEMHGGTIEAQSEGPGQGSAFTVRLPLAGGEVRAAPPRDEAKRPFSPHRILLVDDNRDAAESLGMLLDLLGAEVELAHDGPAALAAFERRRPTAVLLDIGMPGMDGYEVVRRLRQRAATPAVPIIALTGWGQEADRRRVREAGFDHHLIKPVDVEALRTLLASLACP